MNGKDKNLIDDFLYKYRDNHNGSVSFSDSIREQTETVIPMVHVRERAEEPGIVMIED